MTGMKRLLYEEQIGLFTGHTALLYIYCNLKKILLFYTFVYCYVQKYTKNNKILKWPLEIASQCGGISQNQH